MLEHLGAQHEVDARIRTSGGLRRAGEVGAVFGGEIQGAYVIATSLEDRLVRTAQRPDVECHRVRAVRPDEAEQSLDVLP